jgi:hypothetical protein
MQGESDGVQSTTSTPGDLLGAGHQVAGLDGASCGHVEEFVHCLNVA